MQIPDISVSVSSIENGKFALIYGADNIYVDLYSLLINSEIKNQEDEMLKLINFAHSLSKKIYLDLSLYSSNVDIRLLSDVLKEVSFYGWDGVIALYLGVVKLLKFISPSLPLIISCPFPHPNFLDISFFQEQGAVRVILPPQISLDELREIRAKVDVELDALVHGPICIASFSGCFLNNFFSYGGKILPTCSLECKRKYYLWEEEKEEMYPVWENKENTHIFNVKDLCMLEHLPQFIETGINSVRINTFTKSIYYTAVVCRIYRQTLNNFLESKIYQIDHKYHSELQPLASSGYTTFFYFGDMNLTSISYSPPPEKREKMEIVGIVDYYDNLKKTAFLDLRGTLHQGDIIEFISPDFLDFKQKINFIKDEIREIKFIPTVPRKIAIGVEYPVKPYDLVRRRK